MNNFGGRPPILRLLYPIALRARTLRAAHAYSSGTEQILRTQRRRWVRKNSKNFGGRRQASVDGLKCVDRQMEKVRRGPARSPPIPRIPRRASSPVGARGRPPTTADARRRPSVERGSMDDRQKNWRACREPADARGRPPNFFAGLCPAF